ncbi:MAG TPA: DNA gyrase inhibitor YacG [Deltaproteobacteria bacterium]|nr:DNA gyrase inhibitor YacG [Deltaproteobacteria bacterium]
MNSGKMRMVRCPACKKMVTYDDNPFRPFCSRGCKGLDLINWADESYRIERNEQDGEDLKDGE